MLEQLKRDRIGRMRLYEFYCQYVDRRQRPACATGTAG